MSTYSNPIYLAKKLISLPSFVSDQQDEKPVADFLYSYLKTNFSTMVVEKQYLRNSLRYNLILRGLNQPKLVVIGHIDTVQPSDSWSTDPLNAVLKQGMLYGLGAADMKSSLAAFLCALVKEKNGLNLQDLFVLFYVDEEYDFEGLKKFVTSRYIKGLNPDLLLSLDGSLEVINSCRGLIEVDILVKGKSGHSSNPGNGINAITQTVAAGDELAQELNRYTSKILGPSTLNFAFIQGGVSSGINKQEIVWLRQGNLIADTVNAIIEIRPSLASVNSLFIRKRLVDLLEKRGLKLKKYGVKHSLAPWLPQESKNRFIDVKDAYKAAGLQFKASDQQLKGYLDVQLLAEKVSCSTFVIGTGGFNKHGPNECVPIDNINQATNLYRKLLKEKLR